MVLLREINMQRWSDSYYSLTAYPFATPAQPTRYSCSTSPEPPISFGMSFGFGNPSLMRITIAHGSPPWYRLEVNLV